MPKLLLDHHRGTLHSHLFSAALLFCTQILVFFTLVNVSVLVEEELSSVLYYFLN